MISCNKKTIEKPGADNTSNTTIGQKKFLSHSHNAVDSAIKITVIGDRLAFNNFSSYEKTVDLFNSDTTAFNNLLNSAGSFTSYLKAFRSSGSSTTHYTSEDSLLTDVQFMSSILNPDMIVQIDKFIIKIDVNKGVSYVLQNKYSGQIASLLAEDTTNPNIMVFDNAENGVDLLQRGILGTIRNIEHSDSSARYKIGAARCPGHSNIGGWQLPYIYGGGHYRMKCGLAYGNYYVYHILWASLKNQYNCFLGIIWCNIAYLSTTKTGLSIRRAKMRKRIRIWYFAIFILMSFWKTACGQTQFALVPSIGIGPEFSHSTIYSSGTIWNSLFKNGINPPANPILQTYTGPFTIPVSLYLEIIPANTKFELMAGITSGSTTIYGAGGTGDFRTPVYIVYHVHEHSRMETDTIKGNAKIYHHKSIISVIGGISLIYMTGPNILLDESGAELVMNQDTIFSSEYTKLEDRIGVSVSGGLMWTLYSNRKTDKELLSFSLCFEYGMVNLLKDDLYFYKTVNGGQWHSQEISRGSQLILSMDIPIKL